MTRDVLIRNNQFIVENNDNEELIYSVVRCHRTSNLCARKNSILIKLGGVNSSFVVSNCLNVHIDKNTVICFPNASVTSFIDVKYSKECFIKNNSFESNQCVALLNTEYNYYLCVEKNVFAIRDEDVKKIEFFVQQSNHYSYPSKVVGKLYIRNNVLKLNDVRKVLLNTNNNYDYSVSYKNNILKAY